MLNYQRVYNTVYTLLSLSTSLPLMASDSARAGVRDAMSQDEKRPGRGSIVNKHGIKKPIFIAGGYGIMYTYVYIYICIL